MENFQEYFDVVLNPFTKEIKLTHHISEEGCYEKELTYNEIDEWQSFSFKGTDFDLHVHYDEEMTVCVYRINKEFPDCSYNDSLKVNLIIKLNEL
jgi:hypothetical protein